jgi:hypothetical protein
VRDLATREGRLIVPCDGGAEDPDDLRVFLEDVKSALEERGVPATRQ